MAFLPIKFLLTFPWRLYLISLKQWSFFSCLNLLNKVENDLLLCQDSTVPIHFSSLQFAFKMIYSGKYKQNFLLDCVLSDLPVANEWKLFVIWEYASRKC